MGSSTTALLQLELQERSLPLPNTGSPFQTLDWLPNYFGCSWVAFASRNSLVISLTPSPTSSHEAELGFSQVIDSSEDVPVHITCVRWAPSLLGLLGASRGHVLSIFKPQFSNIHGGHISPDFPCGWVLANALEHTSNIWSFGWTDSGDGLLSVGTEVVMWRQKDSRWHQLWMSSVAHPQVFAAATWTADGLAATAEGSVALEDQSNQVINCSENSMKGRATVWWWDDSLGLLESELIHPREIVFIQWRPSKGTFVSEESFRLVLLTACKDGAVRLWLEIDSGRARLDKASGKDVSAKYLKPAFFVSAVIEAEQCLQGVLGADAFVRWPIEYRTAISDSVFPSSSNTIAKRQNINSCEWLIGLGPRGSIVMWSIFCLDDIYPPRCPRVFLWKQASGVIPISGSVAGNKNAHILLKAVAQRLSGRLTDPPSTLDIFYASQPILFQWSRIWPPISALCGDALEESESWGIGGNISSPIKSRKDAWGVVTEKFSLNGHSNNIISIAVHPITFLGLVATLDSKGYIFLWQTSSFFARNSTSCVSIWKSSCQLVSSQEASTLTWLPAFYRCQAVLLLAHACSISFYLISEVQNSTSCDQVCSSRLVCSLDLSPTISGQLSAIWILPRDVQSTEFSIIGLVKESGRLVSCNIQLVIDEGVSCKMDSCSPNEVEKETNLLVKLISTTIIGQSESFTCVAFLPVRFVPHFDPQSDSMIYEPLIQSDAYDFATGSSDGVLSLWKKVGCESGSDPDYVKKDAWQSLESFKVSSGPLMMIAVGCSGLKIAIWTPSSLGTCADGIVIWSIESIGAGATLCLSGRIALPGPIISMKLLDLGNGGSLLGVLQQSSLLVYTDSRTLGKGTEISVGIQNKSNGKLEQSSWQLLASVPFRGASCFAWGQRGSLLVSFKEHLLVFGLRFPEDAPRLNKQGFDFLFKSLKGQQCNLFGAGDMLYSPLPMYHPIAMLYYIYTGNYQRARLCLHHLQQNLLELSSNTQGNTVRGLLKIFSPAHLLEIYQKESQADKEPSKNRGNSMSWSIGHDRDLDDYTASFSGMNLSGKEFNKDLKYREANSSDMFSLEQLDLVLTTYLDVLDLTEEHKMQLLAIGDMLIRINSVNKSSEYASLDCPGQRFWSAVQLFYSQGIQQRGKDVQVEDLCLDSKAMAWALQSECKDVLLDLCLGSEISWPAMRALGVGFWFTDVPQLRLRMEKLARAQYLKEKNPRHCALLYLALQRKNVLMGLLKLSKAEKDKVLYEFFGRDFSEEKNQAAALKNAYTLLGKHQHELAAAFFLLGGDLSSAVSACAKNLGDLQLALVICRLAEGINGPNEQRLAEYELFNAQREGDCWLASLLQWLLGKRSKAFEEMIGYLPEAIIEQGYGGKEISTELFFSGGIKSKFFDPEVGIFSLHLASKIFMHSESSISSVTTLCRWLCLRTSSSLERIGLPLEALEYLHSAVSNVGKFATESGLSYLNTLKNNLALQFQAEVVMSHPCWWYGTHPMGFSLKDKGDIQKSIVDASTKLLQVLDALECDFCIDIKFIIAEVSRLLHYQNSWYLQSVFMRRISQGVHGSPELFSLPCLYHFIKPFEADLLKAVDPISLSIPQLHKNETYHGNSVSTPQILYAMEVWLLHSLSGQNSETSIEAALLVLLLSSVAAWKVCDWVCIHEIAKLIKSKSIGSVSCLHIYDVEGVLLSFLESIHLMPILGCNVRGKICVNSNQMSEVEVWHVLSLVFWNAFYVWARQLVKSLSVEKLNEDASQLASHRSSLHKTYVTVLESITAIFERKLVYYLNTSKQVAFLSSWLSGSQSLSEICSSTSLVTSVNPTASERATDTFEQSKCFPGNFLMHDIWKDMLAPHNVRAILELAGARLVSSGGKACTPECLESSKINISEPIVKNEIIKGGLHDSEREFGTSNKEKSVGYVNANGNCGLSDKASLWDTAYGKAQYKMEEVFHLGGDLLEAISVNSCCRDQVVIASSRKGLLYFDINTGKGISHAEVHLWSQAEWPQDGWASSESTPMPTYVSPGVGIRGKEGPNLGLGGATVGAGMQNNMPKESSFKGAGVGIPGYGGMGALGLGWEEWEDFDGVIDPLATMENVNTQAIASHPLRPLFLVGSRNTHVYLWEFGKDSALATYGVLPAANVPPPYALASITSVRFDYSGHRFASSAIDGTVCKWQLEVGGRSNVHPTDSCVCFNRHASDVAFVGGSGSIIVATGASHNNENLVFWDTLAPTPTSQAFVFCHEGGARCLEMFDQDVGGGTFSPLIVTCGKSGDISVHDFRYIAKMKNKGTKNINKVQGLPHDYHSSRRQSDGGHNVNGSVWHISKAHSASITCVSAVPGTSLFFTGSKDGDIKLWDVKKCELVNHWQRVHDKQMFLQHNARGFGAVLQAAVTDIQPVSGGFLSCGGDGSLRLFSRQ